MQPDFIGNISWLIAVACIWGVTNVFMKSGVKGLEKIHGSTIFSQIGAELLYLIRNWRYMVPFAINQAGSLLFYIAISKNELSLAVPIVNSLTLAITLIAGSLLGEKINGGVVLGVFIILTGVSICIYEKANS